MASNWPVVIKPCFLRCQTQICEYLYATPRDLFRLCLREETLCIPFAAPETRFFRLLPKWLNWGKHTYCDDCQILFPSSDGHDEIYALWVQDAENHDLVR